jgi:hypothetical protein
MDIQILTAFTQALPKVEVGVQTEVLMEESPASESGAKKTMEI